MPKKLKISNTKTLKDVFEEFILCKIAHNISPATIISYDGRIKKLYSYIPADTPIDSITQKDLNSIVAQMINDDSMSDVTVQTYTRGWKTFFKFATEAGYCNLKVEVTKAQEVAKATYTDAEIQKLIKKPNLKKCSFCEYRNWVIVNLLLNCGCRAATIREMKIDDVDLTNCLIYCRHTKNKKALALPLCTQMVSILKEYIKVCVKNGSEYLFPDEYGKIQTKGGLSQAIQKYNRARGVSKTSTHLFRHTFTQRYIQNGGNPFVLQKILGHSDIRMTLHYCNLYNSDMTANFDDFSPLSTLSKNRVTMDK